MKQFRHPEVPIAIAFLLIVIVSISLKVYIYKLIIESNWPWWSKLILIGR